MSSWELRLFYPSEQRATFNIWDRLKQFNRKKIEDFLENDEELRVDTYYNLDDPTIGLKRRGSLISRMVELKVLMTRDDATGAEQWVKVVTAASPGLDKRAVRQCLQDQLKFTLHEYFWSQLNRVCMLMERFEGSNETLITKRRRVLEVHVPQWPAMFQHYSAGVMLFEYTEFEVSRANLSMGQYVSLNLEGEDPNMLREFMDFLLRRQLRPWIMGYPEFIKTIAVQRQQQQQRSKL